MQMLTALLHGVTGYTLGSGLEQQASNPGAGSSAKLVHMAGLASLVKKSCGGCKGYLDHIDKKMKCFHRHMAADFRHGMIIPNKFIDHFGGKISRTVELESPNGNMYPVEVSKDMNKTVLRRGWEFFIDAHRIEENDSLLFRHIENSRFEVLVFDSDDCEKVFSCGGIKITCNSQERGVDYVDDTTRSSGSKRFASCQRGNSSYPRKLAKTVKKYSSSEDSGEGTEDANTAIKYFSSKDSGEDTEDAKTSTKYSSSEDSGEDTEDTNTTIKYSSEDSGKNTKDNTSENKSSFELDDRQTPSGDDYVLSKGNTLSEVQEEKVTALIQDVRAETPVFVAIMKPSHVNPRSGYLAISKGYAKEHFPHESQIVRLQHPGKNKKWRPRFCIRKDQHVSKLSGSGWLEFVYDNRVKEGDICVFERLKGTGKIFSLTVHLVRKSMSHCYRGSEIGPKRVISTHGKARVNSGAPKRVSTTDGGTRAKASPKTCASNERDNGGSAHYKVRNSGHGHRARKGPLKSDKSGGPSKPPYILSSTACLTKEQEMNVDKRARSIRSEVPIYVSVMSKSSVGGSRLYTVTICKKYAAQYLPAGEQTVTLLRAERSNSWEANLQPRTGGVQLLRGSGWRKFVHDNRLQVQDVCLFQLMSDQRTLTMMVHIIRHNAKR